MSIPQLFSNIHWLAVIVMTLFSFLLGALWHSPGLFGKIWSRENYGDKTPDKSGAPLMFGGTALLHFVAMAGLSAVASGQGAMQGLLSGVLIMLVWVFPAMGGTYLFASRPLKLLGIDAGMYVVLFAAAGLVMGIW